MKMAWLEGWLVEAMLHLQILPVPFPTLSGFVSAHRVLCASETLFGTVVQPLGLLQVHLMSEPRIEERVVHICQDA